MRVFALAGTVLSILYWLAVFWLILGEAAAPPMRTFVAAVALYALLAWGGARLFVR